MYLSSLVTRLFSSSDWAFSDVRIIQILKHREVCCEIRSVSYQVSCITLCTHNNERNSAHDKIWHKSKTKINSKCLLDSPGALASYIVLHGLCVVGDRRDVTWSLTGAVPCSGQQHHSPRRQVVYPQQQILFDTLIPPGKTWCSRPSALGMASGTIGGDISSAHTSSSHVIGTSKAIECLHQPPMSPRRKNQIENRGKIIRQ